MLLLLAIYICIVFDSHKIALSFRYIQSDLPLSTHLPTNNNEEPVYFRYSSEPWDSVHVSSGLTLHRDQRAFSNLLVDIIRANRSSRRQGHESRDVTEFSPCHGTAAPSTSPSTGSRGFATSRARRLTSMGASLRRTYAILRNPRDLPRPAGSTVAQSRRKAPAFPLRGKGVGVT